MSVIAYIQRFSCFAAENNEPKLVETKPEGLNKR